MSVKLSLLTTFKFGEGVTECGSVEPLKINGPNFSQLILFLLTLG